MRIGVLLAGGLALCGAFAAPLQMHSVHLRPMAAVVLPDHATPLYARFSARLTPRGRSWVAQESQRLRNGALDPSQVTFEAGHGCGLYLGMCNGDGDIEALAFIVLMQATNDQDQDLQNIMAAVKAQNNAKSELRNQMQVTHQITAQQINQDVQDIKGRLDSMNEMSEMTSMRLQMAMDRRSKFVEALSNILKKIDDTQNTIIQNMK
jgi:CRISPR/Cas system CSM-associated protein Csm2 small subunit